MSYYLEVWIRGYAKDMMRQISNIQEEFNPHITLVRPFTHIKTSESELKTKIIDFCKDKEPIFFNIEGVGDFGKDIIYADITNQGDLLKFNYDLEELLTPNVNFKDKLDDEKKLHIYIETDEKVKSYSKIPQCMLRLTAVKNGKIWFSYDLITSKTLDRKGSLNKSEWHKTVHEFSKKYKLLPTRQGYQEIGE